MSQTVSSAAPSAVHPRVLSRILQESYGPGAWHGADMKAALADVSFDQAFRRPAPGRHNIAEIVLHHAFYVHSVRGRLSTAAIEPFALEGDDWFEASDASMMSWDDIRKTMSIHYERLAALLDRLATSAATVPEGKDALELILGITCHGIYHAGQIQLIKVLASAT